MITKHDHVRRQTCADTTITDVIRQALAYNFERIPFTNEGGIITIELYETDYNDHLHISFIDFLDKTFDDPGKGDQSFRSS